MRKLLNGLSNQNTKLLQLAGRESAPAVERPRRKHRSPEQRSVSREQRSLERKSSKKRLKEGKEAKKSPGGVVSSSASGHTSLASKPSTSTHTRVFIAGV